MRASVLRYDAVLLSQRLGYSIKRTKVEQDYWFKTCQINTEFTYWERL